MRHFKQLVLSAALCITAILPTNSQTKGKLWGGLEIGHAFGLLNKGSDKLFEGYENVMEGLLGYYVTQRFSVGLGAGFGLYGHDMDP